jgi:EAL and modified HD-GYP domain-containing signal transduction protein
MEALTDLKRQGILLAVDLRGLQGDEGREGGLFDVVEVPWPDLAAGLTGADYPDARLLVKRIETHAQADQAVQAGADLLQGFFFEKPRTFQVHPLSSTSLSRLRILQILEAHDENLEQLTEAVESDVSLAVRLLKLVNSASFSLSRRIESVRQAIVLVGWSKLRNWLRLIVITDMAPSRSTNELAYSSAVRAKFLELAAIYTDREELADKAYMLGLFSLLEAMLEKSFSDIFRELKLDEDVISALLEGAGPLQAWLSLARLMDTGAWLALDALAAELGLSMKTISRCRIEAFDWAKEFFQSMG